MAPLKHGAASVVIRRTSSDILGHGDRRCSATVRDGLFRKSVGHTAEPFAMGCSRLSMSRNPLGIWRFWQFMEDPPTLLYAINKSTGCANLAQTWRLLTCVSCIHVESAVRRVHFVGPQQQIPHSEQKFELLRIFGKGTEMAHSTVSISKPSTSPRAGQFPPNSVLPSAILSCPNKLRHHHSPPSTTSIDIFPMSASTKIHLRRRLMIAKAPVPIKIHFQTPYYGGFVV